LKIAGDLIASLLNLFLTTVTNRKELKDVPALFKISVVACKWSLEMIFNGGVLIACILKDA
jgi:hypothetical protein